MGEEAGLGGAALGPWGEREVPAAVLGCVVLGLLFALGGAWEPRRFELASVEVVVSQGLLGSRFGLACMFAEGWGWLCGGVYCFDFASL